MKVNFKINTLRGIFFGLQWYERQPALARFLDKHRRFSICRKNVQIENPSPFARKEFAYFSAPLRCTPLRFKKANTFLCAGSTWPGSYPSRNAATSLGISSGGFCRSASSVTIHSPRAARSRPSPPRAVRNSARTRGSATAGGFSAAPATAPESGPWSRRPPSRLRTARPVSRARGKARKERLDVRRLVEHRITIEIRGSAFSTLTFSKWLSLPPSHQDTKKRQRRTLHFLFLLPWMTLRPGRLMCARRRASARGPRRPGPLPSAADRAAATGCGRRRGRCSQVAALCSRICRRSNLDVWIGMKCSPTPMFSSFIIRSPNSERDIASASRSSCTTYKCHAWTAG